MIRTSPQLKCPVCFSEGKLTYKELEDKLLDTSGSWSMRACMNSDCGSYWLDPTPLTSDIGELYKNYPTQKNPEPVIPSVSTSVLQKCKYMVRKSVLKNNFGYETTSKNFLSLLAWLHPAWRDTIGLEVFYLHYVKDGQLLDVGCGGGGAMVKLKQHGWFVTGIDFDKLTVENAQKKGLDVRLGDLHSQKFPENKFDAILLSHVIEHVPDPTSFLKECYRILKPNGQLVALTPNADSYGHARFGALWRGLEVPRHLQIFTPRSLEIVAKKAGFTKVNGKTTMQGYSYIWNASLANELNGSFDEPFTKIPNRLDRGLYWWMAGFRRLFLSNREETALLFCRK